MNYYKRHLGDYAKDTRHLTILEHGAYGLMLDTCYATERPLPSDREMLYRIIGARTDDERRAVDFVAEKFFCETQNGLWQKRLGFEIRQYKQKAKANQQNGKRGGRPAKKPSGLNSVTQSVSENNPNVTLAISHKPLASNHKKDTPLAPRGGKSKFDPRVAELPKEVSREDWVTWCDARQERGNPIKSTGCRLQLAKLAEWAGSGIDPNAVLRHSATNGYQGLIAPSPMVNGHTAQRQSFEEAANARAMQAAHNLMQNMEDDE